MRNMNRTATLSALALLALAVVPSLSRADAVAIGSGWTAFSWNTPSSNMNETPFTFTATGPVVLNVTDAFAAGDRFEVFNNGVSLGLTSQVNTGATYAPSADLAWGQQGFSQGTWNLGPGSYSLTFAIVQNVAGVPNGFLNTAYFRVTPGVSLAETPEPGTLCLLAAGSLAFAFRRVRRGLGLVGAEPAPAI